MNRRVFALERTITLGAWQKCQGWSLRRRVSHTFSRTQPWFPRNTDDSHRLVESVRELVPGSTEPICFGSRRSALEKSFSPPSSFFHVFHDLETFPRDTVPRQFQPEEHLFPWSWESKRLQGKQIPRSTRRAEWRSWSYALPIYPLRAFLVRNGGSCSRVKILWFLDYARIIELVQLKVLHFCFIFN